MARYIKETSRIDVKFIDAKTEEELFEVNGRNWMNVGEIFSDNITTGLITNEFKNKTLPDKILVIAIGEYTLKKD